MAESKQAPSWWQDLKEDEAERYAGIWAKEREDAFRRLAWFARNPYVSAPVDDGELHQMAEQAKLSLLNRAGWVQHEHPPSLHRLICTARRHGVRVTQAAITGDAWLKLPGFSCRRNAHRWGPLSPPLRTLLMR